MGQASQEIYWNRQARKYDLAVSVLNRQFVLQLPGLIGPHVRQNERVLEIACGTGIITQWLTDAGSLIATDLSEGMLRICRKRLTELGKGNVIVQQAGAYELPFEDNSFDMIVCGNLLHLLDDPGRALSEIRRVLKPSGKFFGPTFCHGETAVAKAISRTLSMFGFPIVTRFHSSELAELIDGNGFELKEKVLLPGLLPLLWVSACSRK